MQVCPTAQGLTKVLWNEACMITEVVVKKKIYNFKYKN